jgi:hypothetical protein
MKLDNRIHDITSETEFTTALISHIEEYGFAIVELKNSTLEKIVYDDGSGKYLQEIFHTSDDYLFWFKDGTSPHNHKLDILKFFL